MSRPADVPGATRAACLELRLQGMSTGAIARKLNVNKSNVSRHLQHPESQAVLLEALNEALQDCTDKLRLRMPEVTDMLYAVAMGKIEPKRSQVDAIKLHATLAGMTTENSRVEVRGSLSVEQLTPDEVDAEIAKLERQGEPSPG